MQYKGSKPPALNSFHLIKFFNIKNDEFFFIEKWPNQQLSLLTVFNEFLTALSNIEIKKNEENEL